MSVEYYNMFYILCMNNIHKYLYIFYLILYDFIFIIIINAINKCSYIPNKTSDREKILNIKLYKNI